MSLVAEHREPEVSVRLREYLGADPNEMPTTGAQFPLGEGTPIALVLARGGDHPMRPASLRLEGVSPVRRACRGCWGGCAAMREHNMFRGRIISLHQHEPGGAVGVEFHAVPAVERDEVILPKGTLERLERHTIGITQSAERLRAAGCGHLKRRVLLHGPPGAGKTLSTRYLLHAMAARTTILLTGRGLGLVEQALAIGRGLAPATFVLEDIDLVAAERTKSVR